MELAIRAQDLQIGDTIIDGKRRITVKNIERCTNGHAVHLNVLRKETRFNAKTKQLNPDRGRLMMSDGCWHDCMLLTVQRSDAD